MIEEIIRGENIDGEIIRSLAEIHKNGPIDPVIFEKLAYIKIFHGDLLEKYEARLINLMGLFYKKTKPKNLLEEVYSIYYDSILTDTGKEFTPIQAHAYKNILNKKYFSFSAPTSSGKSFLFRELIKDAKGDIVIVIPSRALIAEYYSEVIKLVKKDVLVLQFIEDINREKTSRRVFIITPERGGELFKHRERFNIELFLLDEAQLSDEPIRGMRFDSFVRRADRVFPNARKVFAHPFIENPEAQLLKHNFKVDSASKKYDLYTVGKIFIKSNNEKFEYFSPYCEDKSVPLKIDPAIEAIKSNKTLLIYISKSKIYKGKYITEFNKYINQCKKLTNKDAKKIIIKLKEYIGASSNGSEKYSRFIEMMSIGVVIHHGSMPLKARLLIEDFIRKGYAKICFSTSTLKQGINMPFDIVWIDNFRDLDVLTLKNLIGRSGRTTKSKNSFDYGYTIVNKSNVATFTDRVTKSYSLRENSELDVDISTIDEDLRDIVEAIKNDKYDDNLHLTESQIERIKSSDSNKDIEYILDSFLKDNNPITGKNYYNLSDAKRKKIKASFKSIYVQHLRRKELSKGESSVLSAAIPIMLWRIQGKSFSEIVSLRHAYITNKDQQRATINQVLNSELDEVDGTRKMNEIILEYSQPASPLPSKNLRSFSLFPQGSNLGDFDFDLLVYDTYDYLDKVISLSLADPICASFELYFQQTKDQRAKSLANYIRFGTNDAIEIWLLRYGFDIEDLDWIKPHVKNIDENKITFNRSIYNEKKEKMDIVKRYI